MTDADPTPSELYPALYFDARNALQRAAKIDEAKQIRDKAAALKVYAAQAGDTHMQRWASEIKIRAERRAGQILAAMKERGERATRQTARKVGNHVAHDDMIPTTEDLGITRDQASKWQRMGEASDEDIDRILQAEPVATTASVLRALAGPHVRHNSGDNEWYTPPEWIALAVEVMGGIDCDPASSARANEIVKATTYHTAADDGLSREWSGRVWMNPPYAQPLVVDFANKLVHEFISGRVTAAIALTNNATETLWFQGMCREANAICFPRGRIRFLDEELNPTGAPLQGQAFTYFGNDQDRFVNVFSAHGIVLTTCHSVV